MHHDPFDSNNGKEQLILFGNLDANTKTMAPSSLLTVSSSHNNSAYSTISPSDASKLLSSSEPSLPPSSLVIPTNDP